MPLIILSLLIGLPALGIFVMRSNAAIVFLALCAGSILLKYIGEDAALLLHSFVPHGSVVYDEVLSITLLLLPAVLTAFFLRKSLSGPKALINLVPALAAGCLVALSVVPLLSEITRNNIMNTHLWTVLTQFQDLIVGLGILTSLFLLWASQKKSKEHKKKGHKGHKG